MKPYLMGNFVGITLALLYFFASAIYSTRIVSSSKMMSVPLALAGFIGRLAMIGLIFYGLSKIKEIHFQTALITFVLCFTVCAIWKAARSFRGDGPLIKKPIER
jgi:hypothetical protein